MKSGVEAGRMFYVWNKIDDCGKMVAACRRSRVNFSEVNFGEGVVQYQTDRSQRARSVIEVERLVGRRLPFWLRTMRGLDVDIGTLFACFALIYSVCDWSSIAMLNFTSTSRSRPSPNA